MNGVGGGQVKSKQKKINYVNGKWDVFIWMWLNMQMNVVYILAKNWRRTKKKLKTTLKWMTHCIWMAITRKISKQKKMSNSNIIFKWHSIFFSLLYYILYYKDWTLSWSIINLTFWTIWTLTMKHFDISIFFFVLFMKRYNHHHHHRHHYKEWRQIEKRWLHLLLVNRNKTKNDQTIETVILWRGPFDRSKNFFFCNNQFKVFEFVSIL